MSTAERAWWTAAERAEGPYSPRPGSNSICLSGSLKALVGQHGVAIDHIDVNRAGEVWQAADHDGNIWHVRLYGGGFCIAFRDRTDSELMDFIDGTEDLYYRQIRRSAMKGLNALADELTMTAEALRPERHMPRAERRRLKQRLLDLSGLMGGLIFFKMSSSQVRTRCREAGVAVHSPNPQRWLDENYQ